MVVVAMKVGVTKIVSMGLVSKRLQQKQSTPMMVAQMVAMRIRLVAMNRRQCHGVMGLDHTYCPA